MSNVILTEPFLRGEFRRLWKEYTGWPEIDVDPRFYLGNDKIEVRFGTANYYVGYDHVDLLMSLDDFSKRILVPLMHGLASTANVVHPLRDLATKIEALAKGHPGYSQAQPVIQNAVDHLSAIARCHECNAKLALNI